MNFGSYMIDLCNVIAFIRNSYYILRFNLYNNKQYNQQYRSRFCLFVENWPHIYPPPFGYTPRFGNGISTKCLIYNATGATLNFVTNKDWQGYVYEAPYPSQIQNGQWGAFLHVKKSVVAKGSIGAVVYRTKIPSSSSSCDWLFCWRIPFTGENSVNTILRLSQNIINNVVYILLALLLSLHSCSSY